MKSFKKFLVVAIACVITLGIAGCEKVEKKTEVKKGDYKEGTYFASVEAPSYGKTYLTTAVVYVNENGFIKSVFIDNTFFQDNKYTTKQVLGDAYGMKSASAGNGVIKGGAEWYQQVNEISKKVVAEQNLNWVKWADDTKTKLDGVSGVTISANTYIDAVTAALAKAKK